MRLIKVTLINTRCAFQKFWSDSGSDYTRLINYSSRFVQTCCCEALHFDEVLPYLQFIKHTRLQYKYSGTTNWKTDRSTDCCHEYLISICTFSDRVKLNLSRISWDYSANPDRIQELRDSSKCQFPQGVDPCKRVIAFVSGWVVV